MTQMNKKRPIKESQSGPVTPRRVEPKWVGYLVTLLLEAIVTVLLYLLQPHFPLAKFAFLYIFLILLVTYSFGEGPAVLAFFIGLLAFGYFFIVGESYFRAPSPTMEGWASLVAFLIGMIIVGLTTSLIRRARDRIERLAMEADEHRRLAEHQRSELEAILSSMAGAVVVADVARNIIYANEAALRLVNLRRDVGQPLESWISAANIRDLTGIPLRMEDHPLVRALAGEIVNDQLVLIDGESGPDTVVSATAAPMRERGTITGAVVISQNVTQQVRIQQELQQSYDRANQIAEAFQTSVVSAVPREIGGFRFRTLYRAALEEARVGGDFYDVFRITREKIGVVIGDVSGKGLKAAVQVAMVKYPLRSSAYEGHSPAEVLGHVNTILDRDMDDESFATIFFGVFDSTARTLTYANGGHSPAMLWKASAADAELLDPTGPLVGMAVCAVYDERTIQLESGDELLLGTDGLFEAQCGVRFLEVEDILSLYAELKRYGANQPSALVEHIIRMYKCELRDDVAVLSVSAEF